MNKSYRSIYNEELGAWVAVAENVPAKGKKGKAGGVVMAAAVIANAAAAVAQAQVVVVGSDTSLEGGATASANGAFGEVTNSVAIGKFCDSQCGLVDCHW